MKKIYFILMVSLSVVSCDTEESVNYDSTDLPGKRFISTNNGPITIISSGGAREVFTDTSWYDFNHADQLIIKSQFLLFEKQGINGLKPYILQNQDTIYIGYTDIIRDYVLENENSIKFTSEQVKLPEGISYVPKDKIKRMQLLEFNDSFLKARFDYTIIATEKDSSFTYLLKPVNE